MKRLHLSAECLVECLQDLEPRLDTVGRPCRISRELRDYSGRKFIFISLVAACCRRSGRRRCRIRSFSRQYLQARPLVSEISHWSGDQYVCRDRELSPVIAAELHNF